MVQEIKETIYRKEDTDLVKMLEEAITYLNNVHNAQIEEFDLMDLDRAKMYVYEPKNQVFSIENVGDARYKVNKTEVKNA